MILIKEVDINQMWLLGHSPWVNANKKPNGKWINNITKEGPFLNLRGFCVSFAWVVCGGNSLNCNTLTVIKSIQK